MSDVGKDEYEPYEEHSWDLWDETALGLLNGAFPNDRKCFLPSPADIRNRILILDWLQSNHFSRRFIAPVMRHDCPTIELVERMVQKYGAKHAEQELEPYLPDNIHF